MPRFSAPVTLSTGVLRPGCATVRNAKSSSGSAVVAHAVSTKVRVTGQTPRGAVPLLYPGTKAMPGDPVPEWPFRQWAAVTTRFPAVLFTTVALQNCWPSRPSLTVNSAPTAGVPLNETGVARADSDAVAVAAA